QLIVRARNAGAGQHRGKQIETVARSGKNRLRRFGEKERSLGALEQCHAEVVLERLDLLAYRCRRYAELLCRLGETHVARRRLEGADAVQMGESPGHFGL